jgi:hypothetical protein
MRANSVTFPASTAFSFIPELLGGTLSTGWSQPEMEIVRLRLIASDKGSKNSPPSPSANPAR